MSGKCRAHDGAGLPLVLGIRVRVQERDRDRFHARGFQLLACIFDAGGLQLLVHVAARQQPLLRLADEVAINQRPVLVEQEVIGLRPVAAADDVDVARTAGDDQAGAGALALDQRVDGDGRAMDQLIDGASVEPALADAVDDAARELGRGGETLGLDEPILLGVEADQIGKRASNVDGNDDHAWSSGVSRKRLVAGA